MGVTSTRREQIAADLKKAINAGIYAPGSTLPRAADIAAQYDVSRVLVQGAYADLEQEGLVSVVKRRGTVVLDRTRQHISRSRLVRRDASGYQFEDSTNVWHMLECYPVDRVPAPPDVAALLDLPLGSTVVQRDHLLGLAADRQSGRPKAQPMQLVQSYLPDWLVDQLPVLAEEHTGPGGVLDRIEESVGGPLSFAELVGAEAASPADAKRLGLQVGAPMLRLYCVSRLPDERVVEVTVRSLSGARVRIGPVPLVRHESAAWPPTPATMPTVTPDSER